MERILKLKYSDGSTEARQPVVIVPCYNEVERLPTAAFEKFIEQNHSLRFLFVNDGSQDGTAKLLLDLASRAPGRFEFLDLPENGGKAEAIRQGFLHAVQVSSPEFIGFWDADLSTPLEEIPRFHQTLQDRPDLAMVIGTRLSLLGRQVHRKPIRKFLGRLFATVASTVLGMRIQDTQCGAKFFRVTPELMHAFADPFLSKWIFDVELIARYRQLQKNQLSTLDAEFIYEQPLEAWEEVGSSRLKSSDFLTAIFDLARIYWVNIRPGSLPLSSHEAITVPVASAGSNGSERLESLQRKAA